MLSGAGATIRGVTGHPENYAPWGEDMVRAVAAVLGETTTGLSKSEIGTLLAELGLPDPGPITKRHRLAEALLQHQARTGTSKRIQTFIVRAMNPVRYVNQPGLRTLRADALDEVLVFAGLRVRDDGRLGRGEKASTLSEAALHANNLRSELRRRGTHIDVLRYCTDELLAKNAFHAQLEATKSVFDKLRARTGLTDDGARLFDAALSLGQSGTPALRINDLTTATERDEQTGFANLIKGLAGMFRNPVAHDPRVLRTVADDELLEVLTTLSMIHRRLDLARTAS